MGCGTVRPVKFMKNQFIINAQTQLLRETIQSLNLYNRAVNQDTGNCHYSPTDYSCGCAIGRRVPNKDLCQQFDQTNPPGVRNPLIFGNLPSNLQALGVAFLEAIQGLHDSSINWEPTGLSPQGRATVGQLCENFGLNFYLVCPSSH